MSGEKLKYLRKKRVTNNLVTLTLIAKAHLPKSVPDISDRLRLKGKYVQASLFMERAIGIYGLTIRASPISS
jgi:hypothetical protein